MTIDVVAVTRVFHPRSSAPVIALSDVSLHVPDGALMVVVGPSGSGKTTLLRTVAGLEPLDSGGVAIDGEDVTGLSPGERGVAMVFQDQALLPHLTVRENIAFGARARGAKGPRLAKLTIEAAETVGATEFLDRYPQQLSGGQQQRVALARALLRQPRAFLLDEPLASLDADLRLRMRTEIRAVQRRLGVPTLYVTHDQQEALALADQVVVLHDGKVAQVGSPIDVYERPANVFVARYFGALPMVLLPNMSAPSDELGIRPEHIELVHAPAGRVTGEVMTTEPQGDHTLVHLTVLGRRVVVRTASSQVRVLAGDSVGLSWPPNVEYHFDAEGQAKR